MIVRGKFIQMLRKHGNELRALLMLVDGLMAAGLLIAATVIRFGDDWSTHWREVVPDPLVLVVAYSGVWIAILAFNGLYRSKARWTIRSEAVDMLRATAMMAAVLLVVVKFRTMTADAESRFNEVAKRGEGRGAAFKMAADPRVTGLGRFHRRTSLDELPQPWNVLRGESLVGARPAPPRELDTYDLWHRRRLSMKPGITALWQVTAGQSNDFDEPAELDFAYIDRWSFWLDFKILLRTIPAAFEGR